jgi:periplasmic protein TonB
VALTNEFRTGVISSSSPAKRPGEASQRLMRRGAGAARRAHAQMGLATLAFLGLCALGFASSVALAGPASPQQVTTGETTTATTTAPSTAATTTAPAPDPKPPPPPKPDPKPRKATRVTPPPPPPPPPAPAPQPEAPQSAPPTAVAPPPPPAPSPPALPTRQKTTKVAPRPHRRARLRSTKRAQPASREPSQFAADAKTLAAPAPELPETDSRVSGPLLAFVPLFSLGLLLLAASAISPWRVPWPAISEPLYLHRANLASIGMGTIALALLCLSIAVLL